jgi:hypothetical protein
VRRDAGQELVLDAQRVQARTTRQALLGQVGLGVERSVVEAEAAQDGFGRLSPG